MLFHTLLVTSDLNGLLHLWNYRWNPTVDLQDSTRDVPEEGLYGLAPTNFVDRVIIGPTKFPAGIYDALMVLLAEVGVPNPAEKIIFWRRLYVNRGRTFIDHFVWGRGAADDLYLKISMVGRKKPLWFWVTGPSKH